MPSINSSFVLTSENFRFRFPPFAGNRFRKETSEEVDMVLSRAFICFLLLSVCTAVATSQFPSTSSNVRWRTVASGSSSTETRQKLQLASERTELENLWQRVLLQNRSQPIVDFNKDRLAIIFLGTRSTGGFSAQVSQVIDGGGATATIIVNEVYPGPKQRVTQSMTSPWVMIAIDRTKLDLGVKFQKVEDNSLPSFQVNPLTSITFLPWNPCGYGYGGYWSDPCGFGFDTPNDFQSWCSQNSFDTSILTGTIDFRQNRLVFIGGGDYGLGFSLQIGDIFVRGGEAIIQMRRVQQQIDSNQRPYMLLALPRDSKKVTVEYVLTGPECYVDSGMALPLQRPGSWIFQSQAEWEEALFDNGARSPQSINSFDYAKSNIGVVYLGQLQPNILYAIDRVALRGQSATVYLKKSVSSIGTALNAPYFVFKFDKKVRNLRVVEL